MARIDQRTAGRGVAQGCRQPFEHKDFCDPVGAALYTQDLPAWVQRACHDRVPLAPDLIAGRGFRLFMQELAERELGLKPKARAVWTEREVWVELSFAMGRLFTHRVEQPDWKASGIEQCKGASECFRDPAFAGVDFPQGTQRLKRTNGPERLLILGDSFGAGASSGLIDYFDEAVALNVWAFIGAPDDKKDRVWQALAIDWRPTRIILLVCDENVFHLPQYLNEIARLGVSGK